MSKLRTAAALAGVATVLTVGATVPASAAGTSDIKVCNSSKSYEAVRAYKTDNSYSKTLYDGDCTGWINNTGSNPVRVQTWRAYAIAVEDGPYGQCHDPNNASNPPNGTYPKAVYYRNDVTSYCSWLLKP